MTKSFITLFISSFILITSCSSDGNEQINSSRLHKLIVEAIAGDQEANVSLKGLLSSKHLFKDDYNQLSIDSLSVKDKVYYSVIIEYYDPSLNLFAIYDNDFNFYLLDKSLNGNISGEWAQMGERKFVFLQERFLTKDVLSLDRLSIYEIYDESASLVFRSLNRFVEANEICTQTIELITKDKIQTKMQGLKDATLNEQKDVFFFNPNSKKYSSKWNLFNNYVKQQIKEFNWITTKPQIPAEFIESGSNLTEKGFQISLGADWEEIPVFIEDRLLRKSLSGPKYINKILGAGFTILEIPKGDEGQEYSPYDLVETMTGRYSVKATSVYEVGKNYFQIFEHSCGEKNYLLLFECTKSNYSQNKKLLDEIINSFTIDC